MKTEERRDQQRQAHFDKYEALAHELGLDKLRARIPTSPERIKAALEAGDDALNTIGLLLWDKAAGVGPSRPNWPSQDLRATLHDWRVKGPQLSLAERVCVLKHVARYHYADL